jgi:hypothetical protein
VPAYGFAVIAVGGACLLRIAFADILGSGIPYVTFYPAVMVSALLCGFGPGLLATGLSALYVGIWILPPVGQFAISGTADAIGLALFGSTGVFISTVAGLYSRASANAAAYERAQRARPSSPQPAPAAPDPPYSPQAALTFKKRLAFDATLALVLTILVSVGWLAYRDMNAATETDRSITHTYLVHRIINT